MILLLIGVVEMRGRYAGKSLVESLPAG
jgi:hypothetical protein